MLIGQFMGLLGSQLKHVLRRIRLAATFTAVTLVALTLGVGANAAIFSSINRLPRMPLPYPQLVGVWRSAPGINIERPAASPAGSLVRPQIYGISFVRFKASDLAKSTAFYSKTLGLPSGRYACQGLPNPCFLVNAWQHVELTQAASQGGGSFLEEVGF